LIIDHFPTGQASTLPLPLYRFKHFSYQQIVRIAAHNAKAIITPSLATKEEILSHYKVSDSKVFVTYEGVDSGFSGKKGKSTIDAPYFLYIGNAYPHKNLERVVKAFAVLKE
jgi:glycosyltransferase involved in cell wall biosynthesis